MSRKKFEVIGTIGPDTPMLGTTHAKVQEALSAGFQAEFELQRARARADYANWLATQPTDAFAPATHAEVMALYDQNCGTEDLAAASSAGISIAERIAQSESVPARKEALDRARVRRALAALRMGEIAKMSPEEAIEALCSTPEGKAQYEHIRTRAAGTPYRPLGYKDESITVDELICSFTPTAEAAAEMEQASQDVRLALGLEGSRSVLQPLAGAVATLLAAGSGTISAGLESAGPSEPEWSLEDKRLIGEIAVAIPKITAGDISNAAIPDLRVALGLLVRVRESLAGGFESDGSMEAEWSQDDKSLVARIDDVLMSVYAKELLGSAQG